VPLDRPETGLVIRYNFLWPREHDQGAEHRRKARPACVAVLRTLAVALRARRVRVVKRET
jgi:hypothetical protein